MRTLLVATLAIPVSPLALTPDVYPCEEQADLSPSILDVGDECGSSVASEGSRLAVGAPNHDGKGAVFIYSFDGTSWDLDATIVPNQIELGDQFGCSVSLSGELLAVGAKTDDTEGTNAGAVYIFEEVSSTQWAIQEKLVPSETGDGEFGESVSLWDDTVAIGEKLSARVYVFRQEGSDWVEEGDGDGSPIDSPGLPPATVTASSFGESVALYQDTLLVGDDDLTTASPANTKLGCAYVYRRVDDAWSLAQTIENTEIVTEAEHFGESVALHGRWAVIGAPQFDVGEAGGQGVAYTYRTNNAGQYVMQSTLVGSDSGSGDSFGKAVTVHAGILLVGAPTKTVGSASSAGMVYQFSLIDGSWTELGSYDPGDLAQYDRLGWSVAAGSYAVIGIPGDISSAPGRALVWTFCE